MKLTCSPNYIGKIPNDASAAATISIIRFLLKSTIFGLRIHARNPNRRQFDMSATPSQHKSRYGQDLPQKYATTFALYLRDRKVSFCQKKASDRDFAKGMVTAAFKIANKLSKV